MPPAYDPFPPHNHDRLLANVLHIDIQVRDEMEGTWQKRLEALRHRESEFNEKLSKQEADAE